MMFGNYYIILGVSYDATQDEIRNAYRRRAKELHPDVTGADRKAFQDVQEAYSALRDPSRRRQYDRRNSVSSGPAGESGISTEPIVPTEDLFGPEGVSLRDSFRTFRPSFEELFERLWRNFGGPPGSKSERAEPLRLELILTPEEAQRGGQVRVNVPARTACSNCGGTGQVGFFECLRCDGRGWMDGERPVWIALPAGVPDGSAARVSLEGLGIHNLYLVVHFRVQEGWRF